MIFWHKSQLNCPPATCGNNCGGVNFKCTNGQCIPMSWKCSGRRDCGDWSDESVLSCGDSCENVRNGGFACSDGQCIQASNKCDGRHCNGTLCDYGCRDAEDESEEVCGDDCGGVNFRCADGQCIKAAFMCDGQQGGDSIKFRNSFRVGKDFQNTYREHPGP